MFTDPQSVTINSVATSLPRVATGPTSANYANPDGTVKMKLSHSDLPGRVRHLARLDQTKVAADPLTAESEYKSLGVYIVVDEPTFGFTDTEIGYIVSALTAWLSPANVAKLLGRET